MENFWENFINYNGGEYFARIQFDKLCAQLLSNYYPGKQIVNANRLNTEDIVQDLFIVYLSKFFVDGLTNSRKGQIRKAFNKTIEIAQDRGIQIFKWVFCTPYILSEEEEKWWSQWKYKNEEQYKIEIELLDGQRIIELLKDYQILDIWSKKQNNKTDIEEQDQEELLEFELSESADQIKEDYDKQIKAGQQEVIEKLDNNQEEKTEIRSSGREITNHQDKIEKEVEDETEVINKQEQRELTQTGEESITEDKNFTDQEYEFSKNLISKALKHNSILERIFAEIEKLSKEEKEVFDKQREISEFELEKLMAELDEVDKLIDFYSKEKTLPKALDLYTKAKSAEVNKNYLKAVFFYEFLKEKDSDKDKKEYESLFKNKIQEIHKSFKESEINLVLIEKILQGDILFSRDKKLEALEQYEEALKLRPNNKEVKVKYNELFGDLLMQNGLYKQAEKAYSLAYETLKNKHKDRKQLLSHKKKIASIMSLYISINRLPILLLPVKFLEEKDPNLRLINQKEYNRLKRFSLYLSIFIILFFVGWGIKKMNISSIVIHSKPHYASAAVGLDDVAIAKGDYFMQKFNVYKYLRVHVLDSAIKAYQRAAAYNRYDTVALKKYKYAKYYLDAYKQLAEVRLKKNPQKFFKVVAPPSEGLRLVKYLYDPTNPKLAKFGYIDDKNNMVIAPLFDFDYNRRMSKGRESFHNGRSFVCVVVRPGDTAYFQINRYGRRVSKVYFVGRYKNNFHK